MFKSIFCKHDWEYVGKDKSYTLSGSTPSTVNVIYCPKCNAERKCTDTRVEVELNKVQARKDYELRKFQARRDLEEEW